MHWRTALSRDIAPVLALAGGLLVSPLHAQRADAIRGVVYDSLAGRPLVGATVRLARRGADASTGPTAITDSSGRFRFASAGPGTWMVSFTHPALQLLGLDLAPEAVRVTDGASANVQLALPSAKAVREAYCADVPVADERGVVLGFVRGVPPTAATDTLQVVASWTPRTSGSREALRRAVPVSADGWYGLCAGAPGNIVTLSVIRGRLLFFRDSVAVPVSGVLTHTIQRRAQSALPVVAGTPTAPEGTTASLTVEGLVLAEDGRTPIVGATVAISGSTSTRTNTEGRWAVRDVAAGVRTITIRAVGYTLTSRQRRLDPTTRVLTDTLTRLPTLLNEVTVSADAVTPSLRAFINRRQTRGTGTFLSKDDIASRRPTLLSDLFSAVQGGITIERDTIGNRFITMRSNTFRSDRCLPVIFVDGMPLRGLTAGDLDGLVRPSEVFGIEIYRAANAPTEFNHQDGCGTILIWTTALQTPP